MGSSPRALIYLLRRDLRVSDNPILHHIASLPSSQRPTHLLPLYIFSPAQIETSGFLSSTSETCPYPPARSAVAGFWRCGPHRAKWIAESVWDVKESLEKVGSGLVLRVGHVGEVLKSTMEDLKANGIEIQGVYMTSEEGWEEKQEERDARDLVEQEQGVEWKLWTDEKYFVDDRDLPCSKPRELPDVFTQFRKMVEPLRAAPREPLQAPKELPPLPESSKLPGQQGPFTIPTDFKGVVAALLKPLEAEPDVPSLSKATPPVASAHPFKGGESSGQQRLHHLLASGAITDYKATRNGLLGQDFSTKLSAWLALGSISARQVHSAMLDFEEGREPNVLSAHKSSAGSCSSGSGFGKGESNGSAGVRFELLWRDYMRQCTRKFGRKLFGLYGFRPAEEGKKDWPHGASADIKNDPRISRFIRGETGIGLIDASMRELALSGWTSNRARQNVASFLAKRVANGGAIKAASEEGHPDTRRIPGAIDWRVGAELYESLLVDYDVSSNWGNWAYVAGVGNDPRGPSRVFNPVKQANDYDPRALYVRAWVNEVRDVGSKGNAVSDFLKGLEPEAFEGRGEKGRKTEKEAQAKPSGKDDSLRLEPEMLMGALQPWKLPEAEKDRLGLKGKTIVERPMERIQFNLSGGGRGGGGGRGRGGHRGGGGGGKNDRKNGRMEKGSMYG